MREELPVPVTLERVRRHLVGLRIPRALEVLDHTMCQIKRGEIGALEAIDTLLAEELTLREGRRVKAALQMARLGTVKTLASFDFSFQPSLDRQRILALAQLDFIARHEVVHLLGPPGTGKSHLAIALGVEAVRAGHSVCFTTLADLVASLARAEREGNLRERIRYLCRAALLIVDEIGYLADHGRQRQPVLSAGERALRAWGDDPDLEPRLCRMGRGVRRCRGRHRTAGLAAAPCRGGADRGRELPAAPARRPRAGQPPPPAGYHCPGAAAPTWQASEDQEPRPTRRLTTNRKLGIFASALLRSFPPALTRGKRLLESLH